MVLYQGLGLYKGGRKMYKKTSKKNSKREKGAKVEYKRVLGNQLL